jgi:tetratricopeptide (TPR) repeat protein
LTLSRERADIEDNSLLLDTCAQFELAQGDYTACLELSEEAAAAARKWGNHLGQLFSRFRIGRVLRQQGRLADARDLLRELIPSFLESTLPLNTAALAAEYAAVSADVGDHYTAALLFGAADEALQRFAIPGTQDEEDLAVAVANTRAALSADDWERIYRTGGQMTVEDALVQVFDQAHIGRPAW